MRDPDWLLRIVQVFGVLVFVVMLILTIYPLTAKAQTVDDPDVAALNETLSRVEIQQAEQVKYAEETRSLLSDVLVKFDEYAAADAELKTWNVALQALSAGLLLVLIFVSAWRF